MCVSLRFVIKNCNKLFREGNFFGRDIALYIVEDRVRNERIRRRIFVIWSCHEVVWSQQKKAKGDEERPKVYFARSWGSFFRGAMMSHVFVSRLRKVLASRISECCSRMKGEKWMEGEKKYAVRWSLYSRNNVFFKKFVIYNVTTLLGNNVPF